MTTQVLENNKKELHIQNTHSHTKILHIMTTEECWDAYFSIPTSATWTYLELSKKTKISGGDTEIL